tara:strand:+ start:760 stop:2070 length:1311 start_codon:yes stop_codon:yes gene_type:complete
MAITITDQPNTDKFSSSEYPLVIKATSDNASIKFIKFTITDTATTGLGIPSYYAPKIDNEFTFNVSDYINSHLSIIRDDLVSFDATPSIHVYTNLSQDVQIDMREIETDGTVSAQAQSNDFFMCKFKHQLYNGQGTAEEYIDNRYFLTTLPYYRTTQLGDPISFFLRDGRQTVNMLTDYSRVCIFNRHDAGISSDLTVTATDLNNSIIATAIIDLASSFVSQEEVIGIPVNIDDVGALSTASGQSGWNVATATIKSTYKKIRVVIGDVPDQSTATIEFLNPSLFGKCPKTFIYMNRFGVHEVLTLNSKTNESVVSSRDNATLVNTDPFGANADDLGRYLLTGARQRSINPKSEFEFTVNNNLPYPKEQAREIALDFFASPVHYCVDVDPAYGTFDISHPDTGTEKIRRITINDGKVDVIKNDKVQQLSFTYRYADV